MSDIKLLKNISSNYLNPHGKGIDWHWNANKFIRVIADTSYDLQTDIVIVGFGCLVPIKDIVVDKVIRHDTMC